MRRETEQRQLHGARQAPDIHVRALLLLDRGIVRRHRHVHDQRLALPENLFEYVVDCHWVRESVGRFPGAQLDELLRADEARPEFRVEERDEDLSLAVHDASPEDPAEMDVPVGGGENRGERARLELVDALAGARDLRGDGRDDADRALGAARLDVGDR